MARKDSTSNHSLPSHFGSLNMSSPSGIISEVDVNMDERNESGAHNENESPIYEQSQTITEPHISTSVTPRRESSTLPPREESQLGLETNRHELSAEEARNADLNMQQEEREEAERNYRIFNPDGERFLLSPREEIRQRNNQTRSTQSNTINDNLLRQLRTKQVELVDLQLEYQKVMLENAKISQKKKIEKLLLAQALREKATNPNQ